MLYNSAGYLPTLAQAPEKSGKRRSHQVLVLGQSGASARRGTKRTTAKPGVTILVMAENHIKTAVVCSTIMLL